MRSFCNFFLKQKKVNNYSALSCYQLRNERKREKEIEIERKRQRERDREKEVERKRQREREREKERKKKVDTKHMLPLEPRCLESRDVYRRGMRG